MKRIKVQVKDDHLELLARAKPMAALAELIWNALDAEATEVRIEFRQNELEGMETVRVADNGCGLDYAHAPAAFRSLGGSWKRSEMHTGKMKRALHGKFGKGRFRAFALGNRVEWTPVGGRRGEYHSYHIIGRATTPGEFELTDATPVASDAPTGMTVEIANLAPGTDALRGVKALQEATDLFALYLRQYPDVRIIYDGVPLDPANCEDRCIHYDLGEQVLSNGERVRATLSVVEWTLPGKRGLILCDEDGFALHTVTPRLAFRGFSYTAYLKSAHVRELDRQGLLQLDDLAPDLRQLLEVARARLRQHFGMREAARGQDVLADWRQEGLYPYAGEPANRDEECERRVFDIYATHLNQTASFAKSNPIHKRLMLRLIQELVRAEPTRLVRILDEFVTLSDAQQEEVAGLVEDPA